jgi:hypothetical protein
MRAFVQLRQVLGSQAELARKLAELEQHLEGHDTAIRSLFEASRQLMAPEPGEPKKEIGFHIKETPIPYRINRRINGHQTRQLRPRHLERRQTSGQMTFNNDQE